MFKKIIFLECDLAPRDATIYLSFIKFLEEKFKNIKIYLISRINIKYFIENYKNCIFILTPQKPSRFKIHHSNIIYILETEGMLNEDLLFVTFKKEKLNTVKKIFVWNNNTKKILENNFDVKTENIDVIGPFRMTYLKLIEKQKNKKFTIGFLCRNVGLSHFKNISKIKFIFDYLQSEQVKKINKIKSLWDYNEIVKDNIINTENMLKTIEYYGTKHKDYELNLRTHPNENPEDYKFLSKKFKNVVIDNSKTIYDWLKKIDVVFSPSSSTNIDCIITSTPIVDLGGTYKVETFCQLHEEISYKISFNNQGFEKLNLKKLKISDENQYFINFKNKYLNEGKIDLQPIIKNLEKDIQIIKKKSLIKIYLEDFILNLRHIVVSLIKKEKIDYVFNFSNFFKKYKSNKKLIRIFQKIKFEI